MADPKEHCETCAYHEAHTRKIAFMNGAGWAAAGILSIIISTITLTLVVAFGEIEQNSDDIQGINRGMIEIKINLRKFMESQGIKYTTPGHSD